MRNYVVLAALLLAAPLAAQQVDTLGIIVSPTVTILGDTTFVNIDVTIGEEPCDSACAGMFCWVVVNDFDKRGRTHGVQVRFAAGIAADANEPVVSIEPG